MPDARNTDRRATVGGTGLVAAFAAARVAPSDARDAAEATTRVDVAESVACIGKGSRVRTGRRRVRRGDDRYLFDDIEPSTCPPRDRKK